MLSKEHIENFDDQKIRLLIPSFTVDAPDYDKIWCLFWWMIGTNHGFTSYSFYWLDYKALTHLTAGLPNEEVIPQWNAKYGDWIKMGIYNTVESFIHFENTEWEFVEWECTDARIQRLWIHLYNQVWSGRQMRQDLFETRKAIGHGLRNLHVDHGWWLSNYVFSWSQSKRTGRNADYVPHYLRISARKENNKPTFFGKIKQD